MQLTDLLTQTQEEARRQLEICNACRYCEGFCAVFPALQRRTEFGSGDVSQLANLCHNCRGCHYACQYVPPHPFAVNLPQIMAEARTESYAAYAWPSALAPVFTRNGTALAAIATLVVALMLIGTGLAHSPEHLFAVHRGPGAFYAAIPWEVLAGLAGATLGYALLAMAIGVIRFWRHTAGRPGAGEIKPALQAAGDVLTLRNLGGGGHGCNDRDEAFSTVRRRFHHAMFYGFLLCFASTSVAAGYDHFWHLPAPYGLTSLPVLLGVAGGIGLMVGTAGLFWLKLVADQAPSARQLLGADTALLLLFFMIALTGLLLLMLRSTPAMTLLLAVHFGLVLALFLMLPYSKFVHGLYRSAALLRDRRERAAG